ncbi:hypothetical protein L873DRAFT_1839939 [Choiromyces venosus 120613-1]|uniref:Uncharacterized protein n=1 Tax=Choiromyces venosus 120613-1 TaxID=1336337 RepID=A0A3N4KHQ8_9PEZI|nr:hypothetical protein L873DRAFT_1839939 [Choiromyces venosus 120613-1]
MRCAVLYYTMFVLLKSLEQGLYTPLTPLAVAAYITEIDIILEFVWHDDSTRALIQYSSTVLIKVPYSTCVQYVIVGLRQRVRPDWLVTGACQIPVSSHPATLEYCTVLRLIVGPNLGTAAMLKPVDLVQFSYSSTSAVTSSVSLWSVRQYRNRSGAVSVPTPTIKNAPPPARCSGFCVSTELD